MIEFLFIVLVVIFLLFPIIYIFSTKKIIIGFLALVAGATWVFIPIYIFGQYVSAFGGGTSKYLNYIQQNENASNMLFTAWSVFTIFLIILNIVLLFISKKHLTRRSTIAS